MSCELGYSLGHDWSSEPVLVVVRQECSIQLNLRVAFLESEGDVESLNSGSELSLGQRTDTLNRVSIFLSVQVSRLRIDCQGTSHVAELGDGIEWINGSELTSNWAIGNILS